MQKLRKPAVEFCLYISEGKKKKDWKINVYYNGHINRLVNSKMF